MLAPGSALGRQPMINRLRVAIGVFLARFSVAESVAAILQQKDTRSGLQQERGQVQPVADVAGVAVADQHDGAGGGFAPGNTRR